MTSERYAYDVLPYSERHRVARQAEGWLDERGGNLSPVNIVTALAAMGLIVEQERRDDDE